MTQRRFHPSGSSERLKYDQNISSTRQPYSSSQALIFTGTRSSRNPPLVLLIRSPSGCLGVYACPCDVSVWSEQGRHRLSSNDESQRHSMGQGGYGEQSGIW